MVDNDRLCHLTVVSIGISGTINGTAGWLLLFGGRLSGIWCTPATDLVVARRLVQPLVKFGNVFSARPKLVWADVGN